jgi:hypothetical protein
MILAYSTHTARKQAARLLPPGSAPIETLVEQAIAAGQIVEGSAGGVVFVGDDFLVCRVRRVPAIIRQKPAWLVTAVHAHDNRRRRQLVS